MPITKLKKLSDLTTNNAPVLKNKVSQMINSATRSTNPFLDSNGNLFNKYLGYQGLLNSSKISDKAKKFITEATGLEPTVTPAVATQKSTGTPGTVNTGAYVSPSGSVNPSGNRIADSAQKYLGTPYVWGGESMDEGGMDCSGFVYSALKDAGYNVGRTTAQGYRNLGKMVSKSEMQPGDLIFYGSGGEASHIGIYIGNGQMIHSAGGSKNTRDNPGKGVTIANVDHRSDFIEARRY